MVKKAIDQRIPALIRNGAQQRERSFFIIVGDKARNQLPNLHYLMTNADIRANKSVLWAYKNKLLGFTSHRKKREEKIKRQIKRGIREANSEDPFELFVSLQNIRYVYYKETENILGNTYGMCILQDFEAITPNILARTIETVEGGGIVVIMLKSMTSLKQLYTMTMDVHARYRTEAHSEIVARFNERFILSLQSCENCLVVDDELNVLPISGAKDVKALAPPSEEEEEEKKLGSPALRQIKADLETVQPAGSLVNLAKTEDQAKATLTFIDAIAEKTLKSTVALTAGRGRGKSAALGIAIAAAVAHGYSNIFITSPSPENLKTLFEFIFKGFDALGYEEHLDYDIVQSTNPAFNKAIVRVNLFKTHRQTIQYIQPHDAQVLGQAELVVIDEAAAIPLPLVKKLMGPYLVFMASTINGYEGTGRSLSLKLIDQLRKNSVSLNGASSGAVTGRTLREITLSEPIRYAPGDHVESWLNNLLCLDASVYGAGPKRQVFPHPNECQLFHVNRDTLFSFNPACEKFLHRLMGLYVASHYKNSPNDLQLLSDAPAHQVFVLLAPPQANDKNEVKLPEPLCVVQIALEGQISKSSIVSSLAEGKRGGGDLIPWVVSQQFQDEEFASLSGARVVRIATHPDHTKRGYGSRALELLKEYYEGKFANISESMPATVASHIVNDAALEEGALRKETAKSLAKSGKSLPPLFTGLSDRPPEMLHYLGVSFGMTLQLAKFWTRAKYAPVYLRQTANDLTGEHTAVMLHVLAGREGAWLSAFCKDFHKRFLSLLGYEFKSFSTTEALTIVDSAQKAFSEEGSILSVEQVESMFSPFDLKRLDSYANNRLDYHVIVDMLPAIARAYFENRLGSIALSHVQRAILLGTGLQLKSMETLATELGLPMSQTLAMFAKITRKVANVFRDVRSEAVGASIPQQKLVLEGEIDIDNEEVALTNGDIVDNETDETRIKQREMINSLDLQKYAIADKEWDETEARSAAAGKGTLTVKSGPAKRKETAQEVYEQEIGKKPKKSKKSDKKHR